MKKEPTITLKIKSTSEKHDRCLFCGAKKELHEFPESERYKTFMYDGIYIPKRAKLCPDHINHRDWASNEHLFWNNKYTTAKIDEMFDLLKKQISVEPKVTMPGINRNEIGLDENQLNILLDLLPTLLAAAKTTERERGNVYNYT